MSIKKRSMLHHYNCSSSGTRGSGSRNTTNTTTINTTTTNNNYNYNSFSNQLPGVGRVKGVFNNSNNNNSVDMKCRLKGLFVTGAIDAYSFDENSSSNNNNTDLIENYRNSHQNHSNNINNLHTVN